MSVKIFEDYYIKRKGKLMKKFDKNLEVARYILRKKFNDAKIDNLFDQMKKQFEKIIPEIPYIGGQKNPFTNLLIRGMLSLAMFRILEKQGFSYRDIGEFYYEYRDKQNKIRKEAMKKIGKDPANFPFEPEYLIELAKEMSELSQKRTYPDDWVMDYVEGDGISFEWGFNFHQCSIHKVYKRLGAEKYVSFFCLGDFSEANILGFGFKRTQTLASGAPICDYRYVKNYKTPRAWPPDNLEEFKM